MRFLRKRFFKDSRIQRRGQSLVEFLFVSLLLVSVVQFVFVLAWLFVNKIWMEHQLYQAIVCVAEEREKSLCSQRLLKNIKRLNPKVQITSFNFNSSKGEMRWRFYKKDFVIRQDFKINL